MTTVSFSMRLDRNLKSRLDRLAKHADRPSICLVTKAGDQVVEELECHRRVIDEAVTGSDDGIYDSEELVDAWVPSWAGNRRLQKPLADINDGPKPK